MHKVQYSYQITINFDLSDLDFELLNEAMENHSDTKGYTMQGGFWYGNNNRYHWRIEKPSDYEDYPAFSATTRQMGYMIKSLEPYMAGWIFDKTKQEQGRWLYYELSAILKSAIEYANELHARNEIIKQS